MKKTNIVLFVLIGLFVVSCTAGPNPSVGHQDVEGIVSGFWPGLWHGVIAGPMLIVGLFTPLIRVYEVHNNGAWYDFGFLLGAGCEVFTISIGIRKS
jgi:hypothetical protein